MSAIFIGLFIGLFLLLMLFGIYIQSVFADEYGTIGIRHPTNPIICVFEPDPTHTEDVEGVLKASYTSINLWKEAFVEHSPGGNWDMIMATIDFEDHDGKNSSQFPACNILISFEYYNEEASSLGFTYVDFSYSTHKYVHVIVFLYDNKATEHYKIVLGSQEQVYKDTTYKITPFSLIAIQNIVTHEFGHALGLEHFYCNDRCISNVLLY